MTLKDLAALRAAHADTIGGSDTSLGSCLSQSGEVYDDEEVAWQGWLMVSKRELIEPIPTSYKTRYVVVTESKIIQWKGPSATNWATAPTMTKDDLTASGFHPRKQVSMSQIQKVRKNLS